MRDELTPHAAIVEETFYLSPAVQEAQRKAELKNAAIRHAERMAKYAAWVKPEAIAERKERHEREAALSLKNTREALGITGEDEPLPPESELPRHMRGQAPSTIRRWMAHERMGGLAAWLPGDGGDNFFGTDRLPMSLNALRPLAHKPWWRRLLDWFR